MTTTADWSAGYVTDTAYMRGYYMEQTPVQLSLAALLLGVEADLPGPADEVTYLELGCGQGFGATVLAAANPRWDITAVDFNPAHIASARRLAGELGLTNIRFLEADLATLAEDKMAAEIPQADVTSMHGVWSWVSPEVRAGIVRLLRARVRPGGLVHVSYNALPTWHGALLLQRLVHEAGRRLAHGSIAQAQAGLAVVRELVAAKAVGLTEPHFTNVILERLEKSPAEYIAHEYMNDHWSPCWHADVAADMAGAKLDFIASAQPLSNFVDLMMTQEQRVVLDRFTDPMMRELVIDGCRERALRHDVYIRGAHRLSEAARETALEALTLALPTAPDKIAYKLTMPIGEAALNEDYYGPIVARLAEGPCTVGELLALPGLDPRGRNPVELVGMLVGSSQALVVARPEAPMNKASRHLNALTGRRQLTAATLRQYSAMACPALAGGLSMRLIHFYIAARFADAGQANATGIDTEAWARDFAPPDTPPETITGLAQEMAEVLRQHGKLWRWLGLA